MQEPQEIWVQFLGQEDPMEEAMAIYSSILAWKIPWTEEPGGLQPIGSQRVRHEGACTQPPQIMGWSLLCHKGDTIILWESYAHHSHRPFQEEGVTQGIYTNGWQSCGVLESYLSQWKYLKCTPCFIFLKHFFICLLILTSKNKQWNCKSHLREKERGRVPEAPICTSSLLSIKDNCSFLLQINALNKMSSGISIYYSIGIAELNW